MPSLHELQRAFGRHLVAGGEAALSGWIATAGIDVGERLEIHRDTVRTTLTRALRLTYPTVHRLVGAEFFEEAARLFAQGHLPASADLDGYGDAFPDFLREFRPAAALAYLPDVARLDRAVTRALHAPDAGPLDLAALAAVAAADHARVRFTAHPSVSLLRSLYPVDAIWRAVLARDDEAMAAVDLASGPVALLIGRRADTVEVVRLGAGEWEVAAALVAGAPLAQVQVAAHDTDVPAALAGHLTAGRLVAFDLASPERT